MIIWLASYPRSGNTLLRLILKSVFDLDSFSKHDDAADIGADPQIAAAVGHQFLQSPWIDAYPRLRAASETYLVKTHDDPEDMGKAIYIVRDGRSACRSFYHYLKEFPHLRAKFSLRDVVAGFTPFGSWSEHLTEWQPQKRRNTLLLKYEDLLANPGAQIKALADFLQLPPRHDWQNDFDRLHQFNPHFFRAGESNEPGTALAGADAAIFWQQHGQWMKKLGYPPRGERISAARGAFHEWISAKGRDFYSLSHRAYDAEQRVQQLMPKIAAMEAELDLAKQRSQQIEQKLQNANAALADQQAKLEQASMEFQHREGELSAQLTAAQQAAGAREMEHAAQMQQHQQAIEALQRETKARLAEGRAWIDRQLNEWKSDLDRLQGELEAERARVAEQHARLEERHARLKEQSAQLDIERQRSAELTEQLQQHQRAREQTGHALHRHERLTAELESQLQAIHRQFDAKTAEYRRKFDEFAGAFYLAQKSFAQHLQSSRSANEALATAVQELNTRLRMLLTSRLLHLGWRFGLGRTPYWNDPAADELTDLIDLTRPKIGRDSHALLQRLGTVLSQPSGGGGDMDAALSHLIEKGFSPKVVLDIGAAKGYWSLNAAYRWKEAEFFMIDPLAASESDLQAICNDPRFHYLRLAIGDKSGELLMHVAADPDSSSLLLTGSSDPSTHQTVLVRTIDQLLESGQIKPADLVKIDVQGFELNVLRGASRLFEYAEVFIIEANLFEFMPGCPRLHELIGFMAERGFYPFDFAGFLRRPFEDDLGQTDVVFVNRNSRLVASNRWLANSISDNGGHPTPPALGDGLVVSVIVCSKDPRPDIFNRALDALDRQTLDKARFEVIVVDNASRLPLEEWQLKANRSLCLRLIVEPRPGLSRARVAGIAAAKGGLLVFVDDDNFLAPDYLERALEIARRELRMGLFGGISEAELESPIPDWKRPVLAHLGVRNQGDKPITKFADRWGEWEPIGAGMVARRPVAERFVQMFEEIPDARLLGRSGLAMLSGEDSLFARAAYREGYACSYQPALKLTHYLKSSRLTFAYMSRVVEGHGRSFVILQRALGKPVSPIKLRTAIARLGYRMKDVGRAGLITGRWEVGYARELASPSKAVDAESLPPISLSPASVPISLVLCTRNPRRDLLQRTLDSIDRQDLPKSEFELIIVDNASDQPIDVTTLTTELSILVVTEARIGHVFARSAGIQASRGRLILFVDDDNFLAPDYLSKAIQIAEADPGIGAFGGIANPEYEKPPAPWKLSLLKYLAVRDHGETVITSKQDDWGAWEPTGAGMAIRREVAERFVQWIRDLPGAADLGRSQRHLMSGDDALFSRAAHRMGYASSYQPALKLTHCMKRGRFGLRYLARLISGHGRTYVLLNLIMETPAPSVSFWQTIKLLGYRCKQDGRAGLLLWCWDWGRWRESRRRRRDPRANISIASIRATGNGQLPTDH